MSEATAVVVTGEDGVAFRQEVDRAHTALQRYHPVVRRATASDIYRDQMPGMSVRDEFSRQDYEYYRPGEAAPRNAKETAAQCMKAYKEVGLVRNIVDMMCDFVVQGADLCHPNPRIEELHKEWWKKVRGLDRSERLVSAVCRAGTVAIRRTMARLRAKDEENLKRGIAEETPLEIESPPRVPRRVIPWSYSILSPLSLEPIAPELTAFVGGEQQYAVKMGENLRRSILAPRTPAEVELAKKIPPGVLQAVQSGVRALPLSPESTVYLHYKKDDWESWGNPMLSAVLTPLAIYRKLELADMAALDGAISKIRVWKLGNLENKIVPSDAAIARLAQMLMSNVAGGVMDLIWTPDIELIETASDAHQYLGEGKYAPVLAAIFGGLGIPQTVSGTSKEGGFTNNALGLKTLIERLQYLRSILISFWEPELRRFQQAMGFRQCASLVFDRMSLSDEASMAALLVQMADRGIISDETLQERLGMTPEIERVRIKREYRDRQKGKIPPKASQWHDPEKDWKREQTFLQQGELTPSQVGLDFPEPKPGETKPVDKRGLEQGEKLPGQSGEGRPKNSKDTKKRKQKVVNPSTRAEFTAEVARVEDAQRAIADAIHPVYLEATGKKTLRELTAEEFRGLEGIKFSLLCKLGVKATEGIDLKTVMATPPTTPLFPAKLLRAAKARYAEVYGKEPTPEKVRQMMAVVYCLSREGEDAA